METYGFDNVSGRVAVPPFAIDVVTALQELCRACGATAMHLGYLGEPGEPATGPGWMAEVVVDDRQVVISGRYSPSEAALAMAEELLRTARCTCDRRVVLMPHGEEDECHWRLIGPEWVQGCAVREPLPSEVVTDEEFDEISAWSEDVWRQLRERGQE